MMRQGLMQPAHQAPYQLYDLRSMHYHAGGVASLKKSHTSRLLLACLIGFIVVAGSAETPEAPTTTPEVRPPAQTTFTHAGPQPSFSTTVTAATKHFRSDMSCYWTVTVAVTNTGDAPGRNAVIRLKLIDDETDMIRSTETILIPRFGAGEKTIFTADALPGDCDREYRAEIVVTYDIP